MRMQAVAPPSGAGCGAQVAHESAAGAATQPALESELAAAGLVPHWYTAATPHALCGSQATIPAAQPAPHGGDQGLDDWEMSWDAKNVRQQEVIACFAALGIQPRLISGIPHFPDAIGNFVPAHEFHRDARDPAVLRSPEMGQ